MKTLRARAPRTKVSQKVAKGAMADPVLAEAEELPVGHRGGPPLYGRMMKAIASGHTFGNRVRMLKLPLIFAEEPLYAGAITQFFWLSETLEAQLEKHAADPMIAALKRDLGLCVTPGCACLSSVEPARVGCVLGLLSPGEHVPFLCTVAQTSPT